MNKPLVSIIMPTYNHEHYILEALVSIVSQERNFDIEILIGDDCSTDNTRDKCLQFKEQYPEIVKLYFNTYNTGLLKNYKNLINNARGKYIAILESDDYWCNNNKLISQIEFLEANVEYGVIYTNANFLYEDSHILKRNVQTKKPSGFIFKKLIKGNFVIAGSVCIRKSLIDKYINIDDYIKYNFKTFDYPLWLELSLKTKFKYLNFPTITYRIRSTSISNNSDKSKAFEFINNTLEIAKYVIRKHALNKALIRLIQNNCLVQQIKFMCKQNRIQDATNLAKQLSCISWDSCIKKCLLSNKMTVTLLNKFYFK